MSRVIVSTWRGLKGSRLRSMICVFGIFWVSLVRNGSRKHLLLWANHNVSERIHLTEIPGQDERGAIHLNDYRGSLDKIAREQLRAIVKLRGDRPPLRPDRSFARKRSLGIGPAFGHASGFELAAVLLHDRAQVYELVLDVQIEGEKAAMDFVECPPHGLDFVNLPQVGVVYGDG